MKTIPILFSTAMVQAIMADRKRQTRRLIKSNHESGMFRIARDNDGNLTGVTSLDWDHRPNNDVTNDIQPKADIGDVLWVRETLYQNGEFSLDYLSDGEPIDEDLIPTDFNVRVDKNGNYKFCQIPNIFMSRFAARNFLEVTNVRVERLQDISEDDAKAEGAQKGIFLLGPNKIKKDQFQLELNPHGTYRDGFKYIWCTINRLESWEANPNVWVYDFKRTEKPENF